MVIKISRNNQEFERLVCHGNTNNLFLDKLCALLLAISPILQHYIGLYENMGFTILIIAFFILSIRLIENRNKKIAKNNLIAIVPLLLYNIYIAIDYFETVRIIYAIFMIWIFICVAMGCVNTSYFLKYATIVVSVAAILLIIQYISHYIFHYTLNLRPFHLLVDQNSIWIRHLNVDTTGRLYRPAAFFLEPSHLFLYSFPILTILLLSPGMTKWRRNQAILITLAMLLSTSGFSIIISIGVWSLYFLFYKNNSNNNRSHLRKFFSMRTFVIICSIISFITFSL